MPVVGAATIMAVFGITGTPFFNGSISKYFIMDGASRFVTWSIVIINLGTVMSFIKYLSMMPGKPGKDPAGVSPMKIDKCKQAAVFILGTACLAGGIFGRQLIAFLFNETVSVDAVGYSEKTIIFILSGIVGFFVYVLYIKRSRFLNWLRNVEFSFRFICGAMGAFFAGILILIKML
jgi:multicomponent Na+:H+ antiporter subunit D